MANIREVAAEAGVSKATVSRALINRSSVSKETYEKVMAAVEQLGYEPRETVRRHTAAQNARHRILAVISPFPDNLYSSHIVSAALELDYEPVFLQFDPVSGGWGHIVSLVRWFGESGYLAGIIFFEMGMAEERHQELISFLRDYPLVQLGDLGDSAVDFFVSNDDFRIGHDATAHLCDCGCARIALLTAEQRRGDTYFIQQRAWGYSVALLERGLTPDYQLTFHGEMTVEGGQRMAAELLDRCGETLPDGIFCINDAVAAGCVTELVSRGIRVPDQISVIGVDNSDFAQSCAVPLSTIGISFDQTGRELVQLLDQVCRGKVSGGRKVVIPHKLIVRKSTR